MTANLRTLRSLPLRIPVDPRVKPVVPRRLVVRGEAFYPLKDFEALNARQAAAGRRSSSTRAMRPQARCDNWIHA